jgi:hypothetical protein
VQALTRPCEQGQASPIYRASYLSLTVYGQRMELFIHSFCDGARSLDKSRYSGEMADCDI